MNSWPQVQAAIEAGESRNQNHAKSQIGQVGKRPISMMVDSAANFDRVVNSDAQNEQKENNDDQIDANFNQLPGQRTERSLVHVEEKDQQRNERVDQRRDGHKNHKTVRRPAEGVRLDRRHQYHVANNFYPFEDGQQSEAPKCRRSCLHCEVAVLVVALGPSWPGSPREEHFSKGR